jgi:Na+/H+ antiporter NhaD/arsenite permease-like protein
LRVRSWAGLVALILFLLLFSARSTMVRSGFETSDEVTLTVVGRVVDAQENALGHAEIRVLVRDIPQTLLIGGEELDVLYTDKDGFFVVELVLSRSVVESEPLAVQVSKPTFRITRQDFTLQEMARSGDHYHVGVLNVVLPHVFNPAFFIATFIFVAVFVLIALHVLHDTVAAFLGATLMLAVSYMVGTRNPNYWILGIERAIDAIDFDVIFLIMSLMIVVSIIGRTGIFQWLALAAYRRAHGSAWRLAVILMVSTALLSAFLNNVTIMLLMAPITIEIALVLGINPAALILPEAMMSNVGGIATLIGDPPNTVIGSYAGLGFNQFLIHMGPIALIAAIALIAVVYFIYRRDYAVAHRTPSDALLARLQKDAQITDPVTLRRGLLIIGGMLVLFFTSEMFQMPPSIVGFMGATAFLVWVRPDVEEMLGEVDWTTLMFFICLFIMVGGVRDVGLIQWIAGVIADTASGRLGVASQAVIWLSAVASAIVNNIPFTTAVLPIAAFLTRTVPGAGNNVLFWSLSLGANLGGNATHIGSAPNVVAVGVLDRAGYRVTFVDWLKVGIPVTLVTVLASVIWLWIRYFWLRF